MKKNVLSLLLATAVLVCCITTPTSAITESSVCLSTKVAPRTLSFSGHKAGLVISNSLATCTGKIQIISGCSASITMELYRDDISIKSWQLENATGIIELSKSYFVTSGHTYQVIVSVDIYNASGKLIEQATKESSLVRY